MERIELIKEVEKWQDEDNKNRAVLFLAFETKEQDKMVQQTHLHIGYKSNLVQMIKHAMEKDRDLVLAIREALSELLLANILDRISNMED